MADFLTAVSSKKITTSESLIQEAKSLRIRQTENIDSARSVLEVLKNQPDRSSVDSVLRYLTSDGFSLLLPEPLNASIAYQLVNDTTPNYWSSLTGSSQAKLLCRVLRNPTGIGHIITRLRSLIASTRQKHAPDQALNPAEHIKDLLDVLAQIFQDDSTSASILKDILRYGKNAMQKRLLWKEYLTQVASGKIISVAAESEDILKSKDISLPKFWLSDGSTFGGWIGRNLVFLLENTEKGDEHTAALVGFCSKILSLGYTDHIVTSLVTNLVDDNQVQLIADLLLKLKSFEQHKFLDVIVSFSIRTWFSLETSSREDETIPLSKPVSGVAYLLHTITRQNEGLRNHLGSLLTRSTVPLLDSSLSTRRAIIATLAQDEDMLHTLLENCITQFGDAIYIKHTPIMQQEALAQTLALCSGYVQRSQPMYLTMMAKSSYHVNGMSMRIGVSSQRARFLGIVVGMAISKMVDKPELQLKFDMEGEEAEEAKWYERLTKVDDPIGSITGLEDPKQYSKTMKGGRQKITKPQAPTKASITEVQGPRIVEVLSDSEEEDEDLIAYEKPDSDPEDEDEDPETINRNRPTAPVYVRDLIAGLRDQENYQRHKLALATAASLIRRKANFGTEVTDHLEELASILTGLQDNLDLESFAEQRQQALIAVLLARPAQMAQFFARAFFTGDYSLTQRIAMLTTLGLGARELAGVKDASTENLIPPATSFPSKQLPPHLHQIYAQDKKSNPVAKISSAMAREMLSPLASQAAEQLSGPSVLQVRTFSSRIEVEKKRQKPIPNALAQIVADNFFFPLTGRWWLQVRASSDSIYSSAHLLPPFLQTLSLLLNASGPNTLALPQLTREYWDLLLSIRGLATKDKAILNAVLFGFLMLLETNENKERLVSDQGKELLETQAWVQMVFNDLGAGSEEDERIRVLAAGVVVRCQEVVEKYQRRMVGAMMDY